MFGRQFVRNTMLNVSVVLSLARGARLWRGCLIVGCSTGSFGWCSVARVVCTSGLFVGLLAYCLIVFSVVALVVVRCRPFVNLARCPLVVPLLVDRLCKMFCSLVCIVVVPLVTRGLVR